MNIEHPFEIFLKTFVPKLATHRPRLCDALWSLETTNSQEAADLAAKLRAEEELFYKDSELYQQLLAWDRDDSLNCPVLKRQLTVLIRAFKFGQVNESIIEEISKREAAFSETYGSFRAEFEGKPASENDIIAILKDEADPSRRQKAVYYLL